MKIIQKHISSSKDDLFAQLSVNKKDLDKDISITLDKIINEVDIEHRTNSSNIYKKPSLISIWVCKTEIEELHGTHIITTLETNY